MSKPKPKTWKLGAESYKLEVEVGNKKRGGRNQKIEKRGKTRNQKQETLEIGSWNQTKQNRN